MTTPREGGRSGVTLLIDSQRFEPVTLPVVAPGEHDAHTLMIGNDLLVGRRVEIDASCGRFSIGPRAN